MPVLNFTSTTGSGFLETDYDQLVGLFEDGTYSVTYFDTANLKINGVTVTSTAAEINILDGATLSTTELNYVVGVTSSIQTQLDAKLSLSGGTMTGDINMGGQNIIDIHELRHDAVPDTDHTANGPTTDSINAGATIAIGELCYLASDGEWALADADAVSSASGLLSVALAAGTDGNPMKVALPGSFVRDDTWNWTVGAVLYVSTTAGDLTETAPSATGDVVRVVGYAVSADVVYFLPSPSWVVIA